MKIRNEIKILGIGMVVMLLLVTAQPIFVNMVKANDGRDGGENDSDMPDGDPCSNDKNDTSKPDVDKDESEEEHKNNGGLNVNQVSNDAELTNQGNQQIEYDAGNAFHMDITTGNIKTKQKICQGLTIRYNSLNKDVETPLGFGWTHGNNIYLYKDGKDVVIVDGHGLYSRYKDDGKGGFKHPPTRKSNLYFESSHYVLKYFDGSIMEFNVAPSSVDGFYYISKFTNKHKQVHDFIYDGKGRLKEIQTATGKTMKFSYYERGIWEDKLMYIESVSGETTRFIYNDDLELILVQVRKGPFSLKYGSETRYDYDDEHEHRIICEKLKNGVEFYAGYVGNTERFINDSLGSVIFHLESSLGFPDHRPVTCLVDPLTKVGTVLLTDGNEKTWRITCNKYGQQTKIESPDGYTHIFEYYEDGEIGERMHKREQNARGHSRSYEYDQYNNLRFFTDEAGNTTEYQYNDGGSPGLMTHRIRGDGGVVWQYIYNDRGRVEKVIDPTKKETVYSYTYWKDEPPNRIKIMEKTDRNNHDTVWEYDKYERLVKRTVDLEFGEDLRVEYQYFNNYYMVHKYPSYFVFTGRTKREIVHRGLDDMAVTGYCFDQLGRLTEKVTDPKSWDNPDGLNLVDSFTYDDMGNIIEWKNPRKVVTKFEYDHRGRVKKIFEDYNDPNRRSTSVEYDGNSNIKTITDPMGFITTFEYDNQNELVKIIDAEKYITRFRHDPNGNVVLVARGLKPDYTPDLEKKDLFSFQMECEYDVLDRVTKIIRDPYGEKLKTGIEYVKGLGGCNCGGTLKDLIHSITDAEGKVTYQYFDKLEQLTKVVQKIKDTEDNGGDEDDAIWQLFYDAEGNIKKVIGPEGETTTILYDNANRLEEIHQVDPKHGDLVTKYDYDGADNLNIVTWPNGNIITRTYDKVNRVKTVSDNIGSISNYNYDDMNHKITFEDAKGKKWTFKFDDFGRLKYSVDPDKQERKYEYDGQDNVIRFTDENDVKKRYVRNKLGWITGIIRDFEGKDPSTANTKTTAVYNGLGLIERLIDNKNYATKYIYDSVANLEEIRYADDPYGTGDDHITFKYDNVGNLRYRTDQNNDTSEFKYGDLHRLREVVHPDKGEQEAYSDIYQYDRSSRLVEAINPFASWKYGYDAIGRLEWQKQQNPGLENGRWYETGFDYDIAPKSVMTVTFPDDRKITYDFDLRFRLEDASSDNGIQGSWVYNAADELKEMFLGGNAVASNFEYDNIGRIKEISYKHGANMLYRDVYGYDPVGNCIYTKKLHDIDNSELYEYDDLNRLVNFRRGALTFNGNEPQILDGDLTDSMFLKQWQTWDLDSNGNWLETEMKRFEQDPMIETRMVNKVNEYTKVGDVSFEGKYDHNGNLLDDGKYTYTYDTSNRLTRIVDKFSQKEISFTYDALWRKVTSTRKGETAHHLYMGLMEIQDRKPDGTLLREFIPGVTGMLAMVDHTGGTLEVYYYLHDILGSVVALTDQEGNIVERYCYEPYGDTYITDENGDLIGDGKESTVGNPFMWTGQRFDSDCGLYHFWARSYSPRLGRWLQRDPLGYVDGMNLYEYVSGKPVDRTDELGLRSKQEIQQEIDEIQKRIDYDRQLLRYYGHASSRGEDLRLEILALQEHRNELREEYKNAPLAPWYARAFLWLTGGDDSWLDDRDFVDKLSSYFAAVGIGISLGLLIGATLPAITSALGVLYAASPEIAAYLMTPFILLGFGAYHIFLHAAFWLMFVLLWLNQNYYAFQKFLDENPVARQLFEDNLADALDILKTLFEDLFDQQQPSPEPDPSKDSGVCFIAGTKVLIPEGFVAIENLTVGGEVLARDLSRGETIAAKIICTFRNLATELVVIKVLGETIRCTKSHPFWTINRGWARAKNLTVSDILQDSHGNPVPILDIEHKGLLSPVEVYNIEVEDFHNYHVGIAGILSHNRC